MAIYSSKGYNSTKLNKVSGYIYVVMVYQNGPTPHNNASLDGEVLLKCSATVDISEGTYIVIAITSDYSNNELAELGTIGTTINNMITYENFKNFYIKNKNSAVLQKVLEKSQEGIFKIKSKDEYYPKYLISLWNYIETMDYNTSYNVYNGSGRLFNDAKSQNFDFNYMFSNSSNFISDSGNAQYGVQCSIRNKTNPLKLDIFGKKVNPNGSRFSFNFLIMGNPLYLDNPYELRSILVHEKKHVIDYLTILGFASQPNVDTGTTIKFTSKELFGYFTKYDDNQSGYNFLEYRARVTLTAHKTWTLFQDYLSNDYKTDIDGSLNKCKRVVHGGDGSDPNGNANIKLQISAITGLQ